MVLFRGISSQRRKCRFFSYLLDTVLTHFQKPSEQVETERDRIDVSLPLNQYNVTNYLTYALYAPLYIAGPIVSFNDFHRQFRQPLPSITSDRIAKYTVRLLICIMTMEFILHYMYVGVICQTRAWDGDTPFQVSMIAFFNLNIIWLKLLIPWRVFRLWALTDGIDPPENMIRCMNNNYSALSFWRAWHRSFNKWIVRYVYIPLGGQKRHPIINSLIVFSFVAIWHDIQLRLLIWGWLVVLFVLPEILATTAFPAKTVSINTLFLLIFSYDYVVMCVSVFILTFGFLVEYQPNVPTYLRGWCRVEHLDDDDC